MAFGGDGQHGAEMPVRDCHLRPLGETVMAARAGAQSFQKRLGIAITTFNRRELVLELVAKIRAVIASPFDLVI